ncbi:transglutaminase-like cysteine peptidase [Phenylobacterium aquaticum]|uniref:transglutaminase-like cysteine peptidase n=1 Tax=Phenylobacterium aquaticum TaxID=1763816 RepID=UPI001F5D88AD|nr:transglutaminase-like cysteine peptidase [Phenylobacterium aquaticum]MCI3132723.1 transglutaminase-like cysteine peptidase [Phenylobacterium aquaticum]
MPLGAPVAAPDGWVAFCRKDQLECERGTASNAPRLADATDPRILAVQDMINAAPQVGPNAAPTAAIDPPPFLTAPPAADAARPSWLNLGHRNVRVRYASTYSLSLAPPVPQDVALLAPPASSVGGSRVGVGDAMARLNALRQEGQVTARGPAQIASGPIILTPDLWKEVKSVNERINRAILKRSDLELYGVEEDWTLPLETGVNAGDCEDFVLEKRRALLIAGVPRSALSIAVATTFRGARHAVLILSTDRGDYVLDSLSPWILPWSKTGYHWEERQVAGSTENWASLNQPQVVRKSTDGKATVLLIAL